jgi:hypothetical protein
LIRREYSLLCAPPFPFSISVGAVDAVINMEAAEPLECVSVLTLSHAESFLVAGRVVGCDVWLTQVVRIKSEQRAPNCQSLNTLGNFHLLLLGWLLESVMGFAANTRRIISTLNRVAWAMLCSDMPSEASRRIAAACSAGVSVRKLASSGGALTETSPRTGSGLY